MRIFLFVAISILFLGCVQESTYNALKNQSENEKQALQNEINGLKDEVSALKTEIELLKFNKDSMLAEIKELESIEEYSLAIKKVNDFNNKFPEAVEAKMALQMLPSLKENESWKNIVDYPTISSVEYFINSYPESKHIYKAKKIKSDLEYEIMEKALSDIALYPTISKIESFISKYPNHSKVGYLEDLIIELEVNQIMAQSNTGKLPSLDNNYYGSHSGSWSSVDITNSTGYTLTIRYVGPSVLKIVIPAYGSKNIDVLNGDYKITASANGLNYAGYENLYGNYTSDYYITTSTSYSY